MSVLLKLLHAAGHLTQSQMLSLTEQCREQSMPVLTVLLSSQLITAQTLAEFLASHLNMPLINLNDYESAMLYQQAEITDLIAIHQALPVSVQGQWLTLAVGDPTIPHLQEDFQFATGLNIETVIANAEQLQAAIEQRRTKEQRGTGTPAEKQLNDYVIQEETDYLPLTETSSSDAPVTRFIQQLLLEAYQRNVSDIHFEPYEYTYRIRMRINGLLLTTHTPSRKVSRRLASRIKVLANLNIAERRLPQDGRIKHSPLPQIDLDLRVSVLPGQWGEKIVIRLLNPRHMALCIEQLGFSQSHYHAFIRAIQKPQGMILITGPTGSGKTVTLYSALKWLNDESRNISTVEDPIEIALSGINQIQINEKIGLSFSRILRALLRQDPDILMIGEIRDSETAEIAFRAAQTGHLVLSTLHTNSAGETLTRLLQMGLASYSIVSGIRLIVAQRLLRKLCPQCRQAMDVSEALTRQWPVLTGTRIYQANPQGCDTCVVGYQGRIGIYEMLLPEQITSHLPSAPLRITEQRTTEQRITEQRITEQRITEQITEPSRSRQSTPGRTLWDEGIDKVAQGLTSYEEVLRVLESPLGIEE